MRIWIYFLIISCEAVVTAYTSLSYYRININCGVISKSISNSLAKKNFPKSRCLPTPKIIWGGKKDLISNSLANFISKNPKTR
jgi:hypothetical protein